MGKNIFIIIIGAAVFCFTALSLYAVDNEQKQKEDDTTIKNIKLDEIESLFLSHKQGLTIINLWATWCSPCVAELPYFGNIYKRYPKEQVHLYLLNIEGKEAEEKKLKPFLKKNPLPCPVYLLEDGTPTDLEKVLKTEISGALPTTLIYNSNGKLIKKIENPITEEEIEKILNKYKIKPTVGTQVEKSG